MGNPTSKQDDKRLLEEHVNLRLNKIKTKIARYFDSVERAVRDKRDIPVPDAPKAKKSY